MRALALSLAISLFVIGLNPMDASARGKKKSRIAQLEARIAALEEILQYVRVETGTIMALNGPHWIIEGANVHVRSGSGATNDGCDSNDPNYPGCESLTGRGNLIVGYNEGGRGIRDRPGSHNLVVGRSHNYRSFGGLVAGRLNSITGAFASVSGGDRNIASGDFSSVSGGHRNTASGGLASVSGGLQNEASGPGASVSGGQSGDASGPLSSVSGGSFNEASGNCAAVSGGQFNEAAGGENGGSLCTTRGGSSSVSGGAGNLASGDFSSVGGGENRTASDDFNWVAGSLLELD